MIKIEKNDPVNDPIKKSGSFTHKIIQKKDYIRKDGTCAIYLRVFIDSEKKMLPLELFVAPKNFNSATGRVKGRSETAKDYNLIIEKKLADVNKIVVSYRLSGLYLSMTRFIEELENPTSKVDFIKFYEEELNNQKGFIALGTFKQQKSTLKKIKGFKERIFFYEITDVLFFKFIKYCKVDLKNKNITIETAKKNFKKYLNLANKKGIKTSFLATDISIKQYRGNRVFLDEFEIKKLYEYWGSNFISETNRNTLSRFLFSCFTGLRISDIQKLTKDNFLNDFVVFTASKTEKIQKIKLNESAKKFINLETVFGKKYSDKTLNENLKTIAKATDIKKCLTFHVSRHSFATNFLIKGGRVENLQKILAHSSIKETMIYVHIVENHLNDEIINMDSILD